MVEVEVVVCAIEGAIVYAAICAICCGVLVITACRSSGREYALGLRHKFG